VDTTITYENETLEEVVMVMDNNGANGNPLTANSSGTSVNLTDTTGPGLIIDVEGTPVIQEAIRSVITVFHKIFQKSVGKYPAKITPMVLKVDDAKWQAASSNRTAARMLTDAKRIEQERQITAMEALGIIRKSNAQRYSQVHMAPKPDGTMRVCIDYRLLNECTETEAGVLPDINQILDRLGKKHAEFFAVIDFTSGFHQIELAEESRAYTAFITSNMGVFEWVRIPMGIKGAPTYFQRKIQDEVLQGYVRNICELYVDDSIVPGRDKQEFLSSLEKVLRRFNDKDVRLNPKKCRFGVKQVEYVGHLIDAEGRRFTEAKISKAVDFAVPKTVKAVRGFVGMANYFADHIKDMSLLLHPIRAVVTKYEKEAILEWNVEQQKAFDDVKEKITANENLFFHSQDHGDAHVLTDASDYGIGGYICQRKVDNEGNLIEYPIGYMSKALNATERNWSIIEKECFAILHMFKKFEYLLRDATFHLYTDHKNLLYLKTPASQKVLRWKLQIQSFDCMVHHVEGVENIVADAFSRLVTPELEGMPVMIMGEEGNAESVHIPQEKFELIATFHNATMGHMGVQNTLRSLRMNGHVWKGMSNDVINFIKQCPTCQKLSARKPKHFPIPYTNSASKPNERVQVDTLTVSTGGDEYGYKYLLVAIDCFSRWTQL
jgi:hypothetical protein